MVNLKIADCYGVSFWFKLDLLSFYYYSMIHRFAQLLRYEGIIN